jgi:hypothetical protein
VFAHETSIVNLINKTHGGYSSGRAIRRTVERLTRLKQPWHFRALSAARLRSLLALLPNGPGQVPRSVQASGQSRAGSRAATYPGSKAMTILFTQVMPVGVPIEMLDAVTEEMGVENDPPEGMIVHTHFEKDGRAHIVDVWDSAEAHQRFVDSRLSPAMAKVAANLGIDTAAAGAPEMSITDVHRMVRGR